MLQSDHRSTRSLYAVPTSVSPQGDVPSKHPGRSLSSAALDELRNSLPDTLTMNKRAVINRLIDLYEQGAIS